MFRRIPLIGCVVWCIVPASLATPARAAEPVRRYVSTSGQDTWSGRMAEPNADRSDGSFASLEQARDDIRRLKQDGGLTGGAIVEIRGGIHLRDRTFALEAEDSGSEQAPIVYRATPGEQVRLVGGRRIERFAPVRDSAIVERLAPEARGHVVQADLKAQGVTDFGELKPRGFGRPIHPAGLELFFAGRPMLLARWPNEGWVRIAAVPDGPKGGKFTYEGDRPERWSKADDVWVHGFWTWDWADSYESVASIDTNTKEIVTKPPHGCYGYKEKARFYALNLLEEIDSPGEWYLDRKTGTLYFWPPEPVDSAEAWVSVVETMVSLKDVSHVAIEGLTIEFNRGTGIAVTGGSHVRIAGCTLRNVGTTAVSVSGGTDHRVVSCDIRDTGDHGITLNGGDRKTLAPGRHEVLNNHIWDYSRWAFTYRSAVAVGGVGNRIAHNLIHDAPHNAIGLSGNEHVIEFNKIHHVCMDTDDAGAFYMGRDWTQRGNIVRYYYFHQIGRHKGNVGVQSVYLDDWSSGTTVYGNVCHQAGRAVLVGGGRNNTIENNIFVDCTPAVHVDSRGLGWAKYYFDGSNTTLVDRLNAMNYREPPYSTRYPELLALYDDEPALAKYNRVVRNICVGGRWLDLRDKLTTEIVTVEGNLVDEDPHFVDAAKQDFRLKDDSPAFKLGFKPIPIEKIGLHKDQYRMMNVE